MERRRVLRRIGRRRRKVQRRFGRRENFGGDERRLRALARVFALGLARRADVAVRREFSARDGHARAPGTEDARVDSGLLHCIDNMAHEHTTAHAVKGVAESLGMADRLRVHEADAFDPDLPSTLAPGTEFDLLWIDLGAAHRIEGFFEAWWPRVRPEGGW